MTPLEALYRCQRAWEATQPQTFMELEDAGLDETQGRSCEARASFGHGSLRLVEPVVIPLSLPGSGLAAGAEPCCDLLGTDGESSLFTAPPAWSGGSAPLINQTAPGRRSPQGTSGQGQEVEV